MVYKRDGGGGGGLGYVVDIWVGSRPNLYVYAYDIQDMLRIGPIVVWILWTSLMTLGNFNMR
jgi:hypothetical protein